MNPIDDAMLDRNLNLCNPTKDPGIGRHRCVVTFACLSLMAGPGCGFSDGASRSGGAVEIIQGKDSAGATIELERRGNDLTRARVIDVVLGTGEAEIISDKDARVEFTIDFPGGATITYRGQQAEARALEDVMLSGTWHQHPGGVFGADFGTWEAPSLPDNEP